METIPFNDCTRIGFLQKTHGIHGELYLVFEEDYLEAVASARLLFVTMDGLLVPFFVENDSLRINASTRALIKFRWIDSEKKACELTGKEVYLKNENLTNLRKPAREKLIGYQLLNARNLPVGRITDVVNYSGNRVLTVNYQSKEVLIPYNDDLVLHTDATAKTIQMTIPPGLIAGD
jgi:16S rRNA processing protein RimM